MSTLPSSALKDDGGIPHDSSFNITAKSKFIHDNLASVDCNDSLYQNSIIEDAWEDKGKNIHERLMKAKNQKVRILRTTYNLSATSLAT